MHLGRKYKFTEFMGWTRWETVWLVAWSLVVTVFLQVTQWSFLTMPAPVLAIIGSALAIIIGFKNAQCYTRSNEALATAGQLISSSLILANRLASLVGTLDALRSGPALKNLFYRHLAWLTALRFALREKKPWENTAERGNARFLAAYPTPESQSAIEDELNKYLPPETVEAINSHAGDRLALILRWQCEDVTDLHRRGLLSEVVLMNLLGAIEELVRVQGALMRMKSYPYARNYYSIAVFLVAIFVVIIPFGLYPFAQELGESRGIGYWTAWLNIPFSAVVGWIFVSLEKVGENSSNPFEGGANDVPISSIARRIEIEMRGMLGEAADLKPVQAKDNILF